MMSPSSPSSYESEASGGLGSCLQQALFIFMSVGVVILALGAGLAANDPAQAGSSAWNGECQVSSRFPDKIQRWCGPITAYAQKNKLQPDLVAALVWQESGGNELAYSRSGAVGLMQVMPQDGLAASFRCKGRPCFKDRPTMAELQDPDFNLRYGTRMLRRLIDHHNGDLRKALKAYGPMDVGYSYADIVLSLYKQYKQD